jgi:ribulose kinase
LNSDEKEGVDCGTDSVRSRVVETEAGAVCQHRWERKTFVRERHDPDE